MREIFIMCVMSILGTPEDIATLTYDEATRQEVNPITIISIIHTETGGTYNPRARNEDSGAIGLMQLSPFWRRHFNISRRRLMDSKQNIYFGIQAFKTIQERFPHRCRVLYGSRVCRRQIVTPLHFYRCNIRSALTRQCRRSVGAVRGVSRRLIEQLRKVEQ